MPTQSLYERIGGFAEVHKLVSALYDGILDSDTLAPYFDSVDMPRLIDHQTNFVAFLMGGPASYTDDAIQRVHQHLSIDRPAFDEMKALFVATLADFGITGDDAVAVGSALEARSILVISD